MKFYLKKLVSGQVTLMFALACFALSPRRGAVAAAGDGGYPDQNSAKGQDAVLSLNASENGTWTVTGSLATARGYYTATLLPNGKVLVVAGFSNDFILLASAELYDPGSGTWTATGSLATARENHTATLLPNGKVLVAGGFNYPPGALASAELYDPASVRWTETDSLGTAREFHTATLLPNGKVLVAGGDNGSPVALASAELYDSASGTWTVTGSLADARFRHTETLLPNGKVLVAGGFGDSGALASAELYDSASGTWTVTGSLATARGVHTATLLPNGKVLVAGGAGNPCCSSLPSAELYDPATGTWTETGSLNTGRWFHTSTLLLNGKVLVVGGDNGGLYALASAEIYDPAVGTWAATGSLVTGRGSHTAALLPNGKVLAAGGFGRNGFGPDFYDYLASAELYTPGTVNNGCAPPPAGLVSWWSGDRTAEDVQGTNPGVLKNGASFRPGKVGPGFVFDGVDDYVSIPDNDSLNPGLSDFTFEFWINTTPTTDFTYILEKRPVCALSSFYSVHVQETGVIGVELAQDSSGTNYNVIYSTVPIDDGAWHHVAVVREGVTGTIYTDGVLSGSASTPGVTNISNDRPLTIGRGLCNHEFRGMIDELSYYNSALSASTVAAIYSAGSAGKCKPEIFVSSIDPSYTVSGHGFQISTSIAIQDVNGVGTDGATVQLGVILPSGSALTFPLKTDATGQADVSFTVSDSGLYQFKVRNVNHPTRTYDASLNIETTDTLVIP